MVFLMQISFILYLEMVLIITEEIIVCVKNTGNYRKSRRGDSESPGSVSGGIKVRAK